MATPRIARLALSRRINNVPSRTCRRLQSTNSTSAPKSNHVLVGGLAGGAAACTLGYAWYHFSGAKTIVNTASQTKKYYESAANKLKQQSPEPSQALEWLKDTSLSYAAFIPGGKKYVETAFNDLDAVREKHGDQVDKIVGNAYAEIRDVTKDQGLSVHTAQQMWSIIEKSLSQIAELGIDASDTIFKNHPGLKDKIGGRVDELKSMRDHYGPEVKEQIDKTWDQVRSVVNKGISASTISDIRKIVEEKTQEIRKLANDAFDKGLEQAQPYLEKSPKIKQLVEENKDALKQGNASQLWQKIKDAASSGDAVDLEKYIKQTVEKTKSDVSSSSQKATGGIESTLKQVPGADAIVPSISKLISIGQEHGHEAKEILSSTIKEIEDVLRKKVSEAEKLVDNAKKSSS